MQHIIHIQYSSTACNMVSLFDEGWG